MYGTIQVVIYFSKFEAGRECAVHQITSRLYYMINHLPKGIIKKLQALAIYQIIGGLLGLISTIWIILQFPVFTPFLILRFTVAFGLYVFSLLSGWLLWNQYTAGIRCSLINQYLQIVQFAIAGCAYTYISGGYFSLGVDLTYTYRLLAHFGITSTWQLKAFAQTPVVQLNFNFVAILLVVFLTHVKRDLEDDVLLENLLAEESPAI